MRLLYVLLLAGCVTSGELGKRDFTPVSPDIHVIQAMPPKKKASQPPEPNRKDPIWATIGIGFVITALLVFTIYAKKE